MVNFVNFSREAGACLRRYCLAPSPGGWQELGVPLPGGDTATGSAGFRRWKLSSSFMF